MQYPNLEFDSFVLTEDGLDFEVDADGGDKGGCEGVVCIAEQK